jgi:non-ribosomal peptide synthetase component F
VTVSREELGRLPPEERRRLLAELLRERAAAEAAAEIGEAAGEPVHRRFERRADERPEAVAVVAEGGRLGFAELDRRANRLARLLRHQGVGRGHRVGLCVERGLDLPVGLLAVLKAGAAYLPLDPANPDARLRSTAADAGVTAVLAPQRHRGRFAPDTPTLALDRPDLGDGSELPAGRLDVEVDPAEPVYLIYTSGSTGTPKGVVVEHRQLVAYLAAVRRRLELDGCESFAMVSTFAADLGNTVLFPPLTGGGALHLIPERAATDPAALAGWLAAHPVDVLKIVPSHLRALMSGPDPAAVLPRRRGGLGGEAAGGGLVAEVVGLAPGWRG